jgi:tetratricopeptide (TPR) repeat protein
MARASVAHALLLFLTLLASHSRPFATVTFASGRKTQRVRGVAATLSAADGLVAQGRFKDAIRAFDTVLQHQPGNADALGWQAAVLPEVGRHSDAHAALQELLDTAPQSPAARLFMSLRRHRRADSGSTNTDELLAMWQRAHRAQRVAGSLTTSDARVYHGVDKLSLRALVPPSANAAVLKDYSEPPQLDGVAFFEEQLSDVICSNIVELFEKSSNYHYEGNTLQAGKFIVDATKKRTTELDIRAVGSQHPEWQAVDATLAQVLVHVVGLYEMDYPGVSFLPNPLWDEGFRVKRYDPQAEQAEKAEQEHSKMELQMGGFHHWHVDRTSCRELAVLYFLADVPSGGETVFLTPRHRVISPRRGAVLVFPASHTHLHAGAPPIGARKYVVSNFVASCNTANGVQ